MCSFLLSDRESRHNGQESNYNTSQKSHKGIDQRGDGNGSAACQGIRPDRTILLVPPSARAGLARATTEGADRLESAGDAFHERVNAAFAQMASEEPARIRTVHSASKKSDTSRAVFAELVDLFPQFEEHLVDSTFFASLDKKKDGASVKEGDA